jgi:hypothetical protein
MFFLPSSFHAPAGVGHSGASTVGANLGAELPVPSIENRKSIFD